VISAFAVKWSNESSCLFISCAQLIEAHILRPFCHLLSPAADRIKSRAMPVGNRDFDGRPGIPVSIAAMLAKTPNRKRAIEYLAACGAVPIAILERDSLGTMLGTLHEKVSGLLIGEL
jgi:hypothetical protein